MATVVYNPSNQVPTFPRSLPVGPDIERSELGPGHGRYKHPANTKKA